MKPVVHNKYHNTAGASAIYIGRGSPWGNPFVIGKDGDRNEVCDKYESMVLSDQELVVKIKQELKGKDLVCFCKPQRCHGDFLLKVANEEIYHSCEDYANCLIYEDRSMEFKPTNNICDDYQAGESDLR